MGGTHEIFGSAASARATNSSAITPRSRMRPIAFTHNRHAVIEGDFAVPNAPMFALQADGRSVATLDSAEDALRGTPLFETGGFIIDDRLPGMNRLNLLAMLRAHGIAGRRATDATMNRTQRAAHAAGDTLRANGPCGRPSCCQSSRMTA